MNNLETFISAIIEETKKQSLGWAVDEAPAIRDKILNAADIYLIYSATYKGATLYFVLQKTLEYSDDYNSHIEAKTMFIMLQSNEGNLSTLSDTDIAKSLFSELYHAINDHLNNSTVASLL